MNILNSANKTLGVFSGEISASLFCFNVITSVMEDRFVPGKDFSQICICDVESALAYSP